MKIRPYEARDLEALKAIHETNNLPDVCMPETANPLFVVRQVVELQGKVALSSFVKLVGEAWLLIDHKAAPPATLWHALRCLADTMEMAARKRGLEECTVWIPPEAKGFGKRLEQMGFIRSPWQSYTRIIPK